MTIDPPKVHYGARNASAAVFLDGTRFLVADDEDQQQTRLRLYDANTDGEPIAEFHLSNAALEPDPEEPEIDIEGSAWHNGRIFWIGSHSRSKKGKPRPSRHRLFATAMHDGTPTVVGRPYRSLVVDVERVLDRKLDGRGVSIEGLSATPGDGLLIAFRSPLIKKKALVIELKNADEVIDNGTEARFGDPVCLDLDGRGIRSLEYWPARSSYLLIAGPEKDGGDDFTLMRWSGPVSTRPEPLTGVCFADFDLENCSPEGLLIDGAGVVYVMFDEGDRVTEHDSFRTVAIRDLLP
jgi:hypothetical protein